MTGPPIRRPAAPSGRPIRVAFVDPCCARGYDLPDLDRAGLGGTEATILRIARALGPGFAVEIRQNGRRAPTRSPAGRLLPLAGDAAGDRAGDGGDSTADAAAGPDLFVVINRWKLAVKLRKRHPDRPVLLWLHVHPGRHNRAMGAALRDADIPVICVSRSHARALEAFLDPHGRPVTTWIPNPIPDELHPGACPRDRDRLLFASSPHKGLAEVFEQFAALRRHLPRLTLAVADPGYLRWTVGPPPEGVVVLGSLSHPQLIDEMRRALCLFYPQTSFAETFGLVMAEANAVGTPVLVHAGLGANDEVVADPRQRIDGRDPAQILERITTWRRQPPAVQANPDFRLSRVARHWRRLLSLTAAARAGRLTIPAVPDPVPGAVPVPGRAPEKAPDTEFPA